MRHQERCLEVAGIYRSRKKSGLKKNVVYMFYIYGPPELGSAQPICIAIRDSPGWRYRFGTVKYGGQLKLWERTKDRILGNKFTGEQRVKSFMKKIKKVPPER